MTVYQLVDCLWINAHQLCIGIRDLDTSNMASSKSTDKVPEPLTKGQPVLLLRNDPANDDCTLLEALHDHGRISSASTTEQEHQAEKVISQLTIEMVSGDPAAERTLTTFGSQSDGVRIDLQRPSKEG